MTGTRRSKLAGHGGAVRREQERAAVVAWLRETETLHRQNHAAGIQPEASKHHANACRYAANAIERGDHMEGKGHG